MYKSVINQLPYAAENPGKAIRRAAIHRLKSVLLLMQTGVQINLPSCQYVKSGAI